MSIQVHLGSKSFGTIAPEQVPAFLALARGLALPWHQDEATSQLYIASPLAGRCVAVTGEAAPEVRSALRRHLAAVGATMVEGASRGDVYLELQPAPRPRPAAWFSLRRPLVSRNLAQHLAEATAGTVVFCAWLDARGWCPTVRLTWDTTYPADELAARVVAALQRFFAAPLAAPITAAFSALLALPRTAGPLATRTASPLATRAASPAPRDASPIVLAHTPRDASLPPPLPPLPPLPPSFEPPGAGVVRVFTPQLDSPSPTPANARVFDREQRTAAFALSSPGSAPKSARRYPAVTAIPAHREPAHREPAHREPVPPGDAAVRLHESVPRPATTLETLRELHVFRITPSARVPG